MITVTNFFFTIFQLLLICSVIVSIVAFSRTFSFKNYAGNSKNYNQLLYDSNENSLVNYVPLNFDFVPPLSGGTTVTINYSPVRYAWNGGAFFINWIGSNGDTALTFFQDNNINGKHSLIKSTPSITGATCSYDISNRYYVISITGSSLTGIFSATCSTALGFKQDSTS